jgi:hypothetical protein
MSDTSGCEAMDHPIDLDAFQWRPEEGNRSLTDESAALETEPLETSKECSICHECLPIDNFWKCKNSKDGRNSYCVPCFKKKYKNKKRPHAEDDETDDEFVISQELAPDSLYTMENNRIPGEVKIGRSQNPEERARQLSAGNNFRIAVKQVYVGKGYLEKTVHQRLKARRVEEVAGTEWFRVSTDQADTIIKATILEDDLSRPS